jgi:hypothetical protein
LFQTVELSRDLHHQCASRAGIASFFKLFDLLGASTAIATDLVAASDSLLDSLLHVHLLRAPLPKEVFCLQSSDSFRPDTADILATLLHVTDVLSHRDHSSVTTCLFDVRAAHSGARADQSTHVESQPAVFGG